LDTLTQNAVTALPVGNRVNFGIYHNMKGATGLQSWTVRINRLRSVPLVLCGNKKPHRAAGLTDDGSERRVQKAHYGNDINPFCDKINSFIQPHG